VSYTLTAVYRRGEPIIITTPADIDRFIDEFLTADFSTSIAKLRVRERPANTAGLPDHQLSVAVNAEDNVGGLRYTGANYAGFSKGEVSGYDEVVYYYLDHDHGYPRDSVISIDTIRRAVKEFLASGGERPTCVQWQDHRA
jgi:hypothetical protein